MQEDADVPELIELLSYLTCFDSYKCEIFTSYKKKLKQLLGLATQAEKLCDAPTTRQLQQHLIALFYNLSLDQLSELESAEKKRFELDDEQF